MPEAFARSTFIHGRPPGSLLAIAGGSLTYTVVPSTSSSRRSVEPPSAFLSAGSLPAFSTNTAEPVRSRASIEPAPVAISGVGSCGDPNRT